MAASAITSVCTHQLLPAATEILEHVFEALPIADIGRLQQTSRHIRSVASERRSRVLKRRGMEASWPWRKAYAVESALFFDELASSGMWTQGPNKKHRNVMEGGTSDDGSGSWLELSGGTDWQGFQGGFRCISEEGIRPSWLTFRVRVAKPELSCDFLTFAGAKRTWGVDDIVLAFHYSGDERSQNRRCFMVETEATQNGGTSVPIFVEPEIVRDRPYQVAVHCDWAASALSVFVDGIKHVDRLPMKTNARPIRFAALYNWRSGARTAFSELMLGNSCPFAECEVARPTRIERALVACQKRQPDRRCVQVSRPLARWDSRTALFATATFGLFVAVIVQQTLISHLYQASS